MLRFVRYSILSIIIFSISSSTAVKVITLRAAGNESVTCECSTGKMPQDGVYMYKQARESKTEEVFYFHKDNNPDIKLVDKSKVHVGGTFPNLIITFSNVSADESGLYWCEFNREEKITHGSFTWLWIEETSEKKTEEEKAGKECPDYVLPNKTIVLIYGVAIFLLGIGFFFMFLNVKNRLRKKTYAPSKPASDSVYEEMKRSNLDNQNKAQIFINPDYQSSNQLR